MRKTIPLISLAGMLAIAACQGNNTTATENTASADANGMVPVDNMAAPGGTVDTAFVTDAIKGDNSEVALGKLASTKASSQAAKAFGAMLVTDHGAHKTKLAALAAAAGSEVTDDPSEEGKANLDKLGKLSGAEFDKAFKTAMIEDHTKDIAKYEKQASSGDAQTAALAKETLPTLRKHLEAANAL